MRRSATPSRAIPRRDMTRDEITLALALSPLRVRYVPNSGEKRFAWTLADSAEHGTPPTITVRQAEHLVSLAIRMRRQLPADVLALAERMARRPMRRPGAVTQPSDSREVRA